VSPPVAGKTTDKSRGTGQGLGLGATEHWWVGTTCLSACCGAASFLHFCHEQGHQAFSNVDLGVPNFYCSGVWTSLTCQVHHAS